MSVSEVVLYRTGCGSGNALDFYSVAARFESRQAHRLFWLRTLCFFHSLQANAGRVHDEFFLNLFQFIIHQSSYH
jgi:hypothetical protein